MRALFVLVECGIAARHRREGIIYTLAAGFQGAVSAANRCVADGGVRLVRRGSGEFRGGSWLFESGQFTFQSPTSINPNFQIRPALFELILQLVHCRP
jgi:hypothetical protein